MKFQRAPASSWFQCAVCQTLLHNHGASLFHPKIHRFAPETPCPYEGQFSANPDSFDSDDLLALSNLIANAKFESVINNAILDPRHRVRAFPGCDPTPHVNQHTDTLAKPSEVCPFTPLANTQSKALLTPPDQGPERHSEDRQGPMAQPVTP